MTWKPFTVIPKNREILITWGNATDGPEGYDIVKYVKTDENGDDIWESTNGSTYPSQEDLILAWMDLPQFPYFPKVYKYKTDEN